MGVRRHCYILALCLTMLAAGCGPTWVGGQYGVTCYDRETLQKVRSRVVIAFYYDAWLVGRQTAWAKAVSGAAAEKGIKYPLTAYWNWGICAAAPGAFLFAHYRFAGVCVLADGYWPTVMTTNAGPDERGLPQQLWPGLYGKDYLDWAPREAMPPGCSGLWQLPLVSSAKECDELVASHSYVLSDDVPRVLDEGLRRSHDVPKAERGWAYEQLKTVLLARVTRETDAAERKRLEGWVRVFTKRVSE